jgi:two-component system response regulator PilR (NtrC family)/two-component system response regulator HydG
MRILAATNADLRARVRACAFREDLLFRLAVVELDVPPLRDRRADMPALVSHFLARARARHPRSGVDAVTPAALARMLDYAWPGNVRELENTIERAVLLGRGRELDVADLPDTIRSGAAGRRRFEGDIVPLAEMERQYARWVFDQLGGRKLATAEKLQIDRKTLNRILSEHVGDERDS